MVMKYEDTLKEAISILDRQDWPTALERSAYICEAGVELAYKAFEERKAALETLRERLEALPLEADDAATVQWHLQTLDGLYDEYEEYSHENPSLLEQVSEYGDQGYSEFWFNKVDMPDRVVAIRCDAMRQMFTEKLNN
jgi:exonuclease VII small subunit